MGYRKEIDGIRAISVLAVIFFHAGFDFVKGGFIGVDIFFVISGFLITGIILDDYEKGQFSIASFYERRARRILPALYLMLLVTFGAFVATALPSNLVSISESLIASALFYSNIYFSENANYFSQDSSLIPLIHTWSLAVEEQFYVIFPLLMVGMMKVKSWLRISLFMALLIALVGLSQELKNEDPASAFFLAQVRGWAILAGALLAMILRLELVTKWQRAIPVALADIIAVSALAMVVAPMFWVEQSMGWPSKLTLIPVAGTCLLLVFASRDTFTGKLLGVRPLVLIGLCSYSAYLWHQPVFAFFKYQAADPVTLPTQLALILIMLVIAYLSWRFVEAPFRQRNRFTRRQIFSWSIGGALAFVLLGGWGIYSKGWPGRWSENSQRLIAQAELPLEATFGAYGYGTCFMSDSQSVDILYKSRCVPVRKQGERRVIVFGDSHAAHLMVGVRTAFESRGFAVGQWTGASCRPFDYAENIPKCRAMQDAFMRDMLPRLTADDVIIVSGRWHGLSNGSDLKQLAKALEQLAASPATTIVVGSTPEFFKSPAVILVQSRFGDGDDAMLEAKPLLAADLAIGKLARTYGLAYFEPRFVLCDKGQMQRCHVMQSGKMLYLDESHLSPTASALLVENIAGPMQIDD